jgi:hypothetical protein
MRRWQRLNGQLIVWSLRLLNWVRERVYFIYHKKEGCAIEGKVDADSIVSFYLSMKNRPLLIHQVRDRNSNENWSGALSAAERIEALAVPEAKRAQNTTG